MRIMLVCSAFNGLSQRVWAELRAAGHPVRVQLADGDHVFCLLRPATVRTSLLLSSVLPDTVPPPDVVSTRLNSRPAVAV